MNYRRMPIEVESPEQFGYGKIACNLGESSVSDRVWRALEVDLGDLVLCYGHHVGHEGVRAAVSRGHAGIGADDVLLTAGAAAALFIVATTLLDAGDEMVAARPNYATNLETPRAIGAAIRCIEQRFEEGWRLDVERVARLVGPRTRLISVTTPHNPTGQVIDEASLRALARLAEERGCCLLVDETYRDLHFGEPTPLAATLSPRAISVSSLSKAWGLPGIRLGWLISRDRALLERFLAAKEQIYICNSVVDEEIAHRALERLPAWLPGLRAHVRAGFEMTRDFLAREARIEWVEPQGGVVCFPRIRADAGVDVERFHETLRRDLGTWVGPGHWFEMDRRHMRVGFGWPGPEELGRGLANVSAALDAARL